MGDLSKVWFLSMVGTITVCMMVGYAIVGPLMYLTDPSTADQISYSRESEHNDLIYQSNVMVAFGDILFGYGFTSVSDNKFHRAVL